MLTEMLDTVYRMSRPNERIVAIVEVRDGAILITDQAVYEIDPIPGMKFTVRQLSQIYI
jgi:hypothetical protein